MGADVISVFGNILLFALVFGMSATVDIRSMRTQIQNYKAILTGVFCQFVLLPLLGFLVVRTIELPYSVGMTLLVVTSSPGGSYSNWWCSLFNGDLALSVTMTAVSTVLSIFTLPMNLIFYSELAYRNDTVVEKLDFKSLFIALVVVIAAIGSGLFCSAKVKSRKFNKFANHLGNFSGLSLILFSATMTNTGSSDSKIWSRDWSFYVAVTLPCLGGLLLSNLLATFLQLLHPERVTVAIECCYQNVGIATSMALSMFNGNQLNEAMGVPFFYGFMEALLVGLYCVGAWKADWTKAPSNHSFWRVVFTSYEVLENEQKDLEQVEVGLTDSQDFEPERLSMDGDVLTTYFNMAWFGLGTPGSASQERKPAGQRTPPPPPPRPEFGRESISEPTKRASTLHEMHHPEAELT